MRIEILGSAAGGAFPQWNCACNNCKSLRRGVFAGKARNHLQVAVSSNNRTWFLLNASPDVRSQIEAYPFLHPRDGLRQSPIAGIVLTSADLDQTLGLLLLRELQPLQVYSTASVRSVVHDSNIMFRMLERIPQQAQWLDMVPAKTFELRSTTGEASGIQCLPVSLGTHYPAYVSAEQAATLEPDEALLGLILQSVGGSRLGYFPAVPKLDKALLEQLSSLDVLLFDGTFWSDDELIQIQSGGQTARKMGHVPVSGEQGSLKMLANLKKTRKIFVHINNTNPMLDESRPEHRQVQEAGWEIAEDGWGFEL